MYRRLSCIMYEGFDFSLFKHGESGDVKADAVLREKTDALFIMTLFFC